MGSCGLGLGATAATRPQSGRAGRQSSAMRRRFLVVLSGLAFVACTSTVEPPPSGQPSRVSVPSSAPQSALNAPSVAPTDLPVASPSPSEQSVPTASLVPGELLWTRIDQPLASINGGFDQPIATGDRFYLIEATASPDVPGAWVLLQSFDGLNWNVGGNVPDGALTIYRTPDGLLAGGVPSAAGPVGVGLWSARAASDWTSSTDQPAFSDRRCTVSRFPGITSFWPLNGAIAAAGSAVWTSADGATWQCAGRPELNVVGGHDVLLGTPKGQTGVPSGSIWLSTDGAHWTKTKDVEFAVDVAAVRAGFVAITDEYGVHNALFTSPDGQQWTRQANPFGSQDVVTRGEPDGERAIALEVGEYPGGVSPGGIWISSVDGATWTRYQLPMRDGDNPGWAAILWNDLVVTGQYGPSGSSVLWTAKVPD